MSTFGESGEKSFSLKVSKNYFNQVYGHNFGQKCHYWGQFGQNMSFLVKMDKIESFWKEKWRHQSKFWECCPTIFSLKVFKNYFSQVYGHMFGQKSH